MDKIFIVYSLDIKKSLMRTTEVRLLLLNVQWFHSIYLHEYFVITDSLSICVLACDRRVLLGAFSVPTAPNVYYINEHRKPISCEMSNL